MTQSTPPIGKPFEYERNENSVELRWHLFSLFAVLLLPIWLVPWTGACVAITYTAIMKPSLAALLFSIPFWGFWIFVMRFFLDMLFARFRLQIDTHELRVDKNCLIWHREHVVPLNEVRKIEHHITHGSKGGNHHWLRVALVDRDPLDFSVLSGVHLEAVCRTLNRDLRQLQTTTEPDVAIEPESRTQNNFETIIINRGETRTKNLDPPKNTSWRLLHDDDGFTFRFRPVFKPFDLLLTGFMAMFWNGITWLFVLALFGVIPLKNKPEGLQWIIPLVAMPIFVPIGLVLLLAAIEAFLEAFRVTTWRFSLGQVEFQTRRPFSRREEIHPLSDWQTIQIRPVTDTDEQEGDEEEGPADEPELWQLAMLDSRGEELAYIDDLNKFEARWMADVLLREQRIIGR